MEVIASVELLEAGQEVIVEMIGTTLLFVIPIFAQVTAKILVKMEAIVTKTNATVSNKFLNQKLPRKTSVRQLLKILKILLKNLVLNHKS